MSSCGVCMKSIAGNKPKVTCSVCKTDVHAVCLKFSKADVDCITQDGMVWRCKNCAAERRKSMRFELEAGEGRLSLEDVMKVVTEIRDSQKQYEKSFNTVIEAVNLQLAENTDAVKAQSNECIKMSNLIEALTTENGQLKKKVKELETRLEDIEQYSRSNCIEMQGIPLEPAEDVLNIVKDVGRALDLDISDTMVDACHRLGVQKTGDKPPGIIVKFVRRMGKESFIQRRRVKTTLSTRHIGRKDDRSIYVNESLSPARRRIHALARRFQREKNCKFLWIRNGKIFMRKEDKAPVKIISSEEDLQRYL
ncbi:uncharacterized protein LOC124365416 [Homalodisca vitripennis]|uniref:uncharacterized protein LOC124365416 n=1 Tax=Homalodisca vitripennis TaxID=197043 RepID=UPI001EEB0AFA|nr:uncharacterized protein LOC124365416 [Homalodisca vitripennis]